MSYALDVDDGHKTLALKLLSVAPLRVLLAAGMMTEGIRWKELIISRKFDEDWPRTIQAKKS